jgi:hypothetical protein
MEKTCISCNKTKLNNEYYKNNDNKCKECRKEDEREKRKKLKDMAIPNEIYLCNFCSKNKPASDFRPLRKRCKECEKSYGREYRKSDFGKNKAIEWSNQNKEKHHELQANWYQNNKERIYQKYNERIKTDHIFKLKRTCKSRISQSIHKDKKTDIYIGCDIKFLKEWLSFCMTEDMNYENHGNLWHIDHVIPIDLFNLDNTSEQFICFNWKNLSPEYARYNLKKNNKIDKYQVLKQIGKLVDFHKIKNMKIPYKYIAQMLLKI